jgi:hypothetical protein
LTVNTGQVYDALRSANPPWDQAAAIAVIRSQLGNRLEASTSTGNSSSTEDALSDRRVNRLRGKRKGFGSAGDSDGRTDELGKKISLRPSPKTSVSRYITNPDEVVEDERLAIIDEDQDQDVTELDESLPCRTLTDWTLFDEENGQKLVGLDKIGEEGCDVRAVGVVRPVILDSHQLHDSQEQDEGDDEIDDDNSPEQNKGHQILRLSAIFLWEVVMRGDGGL